MLKNIKILKFIILFLGIGLCAGCANNQRMMRVENIALEAKTISEQALLEAKIANEKADRLLMQPRKR